ncbi:MULTISPECIES: peptide-methionine (S)-S-oxide reductase MsrA [unclassified Halomonas]|uniref:peptide-methionine (S)-S-oxide reductase MsrA n=1 Tax=unclassified Halomonas TaxID=2609666 RepID=UPI001CF185CC|nr:MULTISPECIES: peptide-methionine (S)-S-oxide reductase MsrA [unclassified Halomonas]MCA8863473.1 peptide-methionine (S)-S-oxide reductase MsrA [Halomonas sp. SBBP1]UZH08792.1 peptide-methionine (S)-S-oxide reductase MsrA [Halomonas sp. BDJS001]
MIRLSPLRPFTLSVLAAAGLASPSLQAQSSQDQTSQQQSSAEATFAGGCFWCMEPPYDNQPGVTATTSGYIGGELENPSYEEISQGGTGHAEVVQIEYDPEQISYEQLLEIFWRNIDPFAVDRQFCDVGDQYRSAIFYHDDEQRELAEASKAEMEERFDREIATQIAPANTFWPAEEYHQDYYQKNPVRYKFYRYSCGRDGRLEEVWGEEAGGPTFE